MVTRITQLWISEESSTLNPGNKTPGETQSAIWNGCVATSTRDPLEVGDSSH